MKKTKTIYVTPFRASDKQTTGPSTDSGFASIDDVASLLSGCKYTGIEREPKYIEVTRNRLENFANELPSIDEVGTTG